MGEEAAQKKSLFKDKVAVCPERVENMVADVLVNFCTPTILHGPLIEKLNAMAGPALHEACEHYIGMCPTSCRTTSAFEAKNFRHFVHSLVPEVLDLSNTVDIKKFYLCVRNALDAAAQAGAKSIVMPSLFPGVDTTATCELVLRVFTVWIHCSPYSDQVMEIKVVCSQDSDYQLYLEAANSLYTQATEVGESMVGFMQPEALMAGGGQRSNHGGRNSRARARRPLYEQLPAPPPGYGPSFRLELSAKLAPTILVMDDEDGNKRQYRLTNKSRDGRKLYFRCSRCDTLIKKDGRRIRAKLIVQDGLIVSNQYPEHHPDCESKSHEDIFVQQVDRTSRRDVKDGKYLPQDAYKIAMNKVLAESEADPSVAGAVEKFPDWPRLRQQYCRIRKTAMGKRARGSEGGDEEYMAQQRYPPRASKQRKKYSPSYVGEPMPAPHATRMTTRRLHQQQQQPHYIVQGDDVEDALDGGSSSGSYGQAIPHPQYLKEEEMGQQQEGISVEVVEEDGGVIETMEVEDEMDAIINVDDDVTITSNNLSVTANGAT